MNDITISKTVIDALANETASRVLSILKQTHLLKGQQQTPYQKTETLLYNYKNYLAAIEDKQQQIDFIRQNGIPGKSPSITSFTGTGGTQEFLSEGEKEDDKIQALQDAIQSTRNFISVIDAALAPLKDDPYFDIIQLRYFEGLTREEIAEQLDVDISTVTRNRKRLIDKLQIRLFTDEVIQQFFL